MDEWSERSKTAKLYLLVGVMQGMGASHRPTPEQAQARADLLRSSGPEAMSWCQREAARMCDAEYGPNVSGADERLFHCHPFQ